MQKTKKSVLKRVKITGTGKVLRRTAGHRHLLRNKSMKRKRTAATDKSVSKGFSQHVKKWIAASL